MPFQSEAQRRKFHAMAERGEISDETVEEWEEATGDKPLPKKKKLQKTEKSFIMDEVRYYAQDGIMSDSSSILSAFAERMKKALTGRVASNLARAARMDAQKPVEPSIPEDSVGIRVTHESVHTPVLLQSEVLQTPPVHSLAKSEIYEPCVSCGYMSKSSGPCRRCNTVQAEAAPIWKRK